MAKHKVNYKVHTICRPTPEFKADRTFVLDYFKVNSTRLKFHTFSKDEGRIEVVILPEDVEVFIKDDVQTSLSTKIKLPLNK